MIPRIPARIEGVIFFMLDTEKETIRFKIQRKNAKKNPASYNIVTMQDIADCVNCENIEGFIEDFTQVLAYMALMKEVNKQGIMDGKIPEGSKLEFPSFEWIDDKKPKRKSKKTKP